MTRLFEEVAMTRPISPIDPNSSFSPLSLHRSASEDVVVKIAHLEVVEEETFPVKSSKQEIVSRQQSLARADTAPYKKTAEGEKKGLLKEEHKPEGTSSHTRHVNFSRAFSEAQTKALPELDAIPKRLNFPLERVIAAAKELSFYITEYPDEIPELVSYVNRVSVKLEDWNSSRIKDVFLCLLKDPAHNHFLSVYYKKNPEELDGFAEHVIRNFLASKSSHSEILSFLSSWTDVDLEEETRKTLFRLPCLSKEFCKKYVIEKWKDSLNELFKEVQKKLKKLNCSKACMERVYVEQILCKKFGEHYTKLEVVGKDRYLQEEWKKRAPLFNKFASQVLTKIYKSMTCSEELSDVLRMRRGKIIQFLQDEGIENTKEESVPFIAEFLFFRILNSQILKMQELSSDESHILLDLTRVIQVLCKKNPLENEKGDPLFSYLKPLLEKFQKPHIDFIEKYAKV